MNTDFIKGVVVPILTPIDGEERIDEARLRDQVDYVIKGGVSGILAFGSNGEFYMVEEDEMERGLKIMVDQAAGRVPVYFGIGAIRTQKCCRLAKMAVANGAAGVSVLQPMFLKPTYDELFQHFKTIAESVPGTPMLLYNNPGRVGYTLTADLVDALAHQVENIVGMKDTSGDITLTAEFIRRTRDVGFKVFGGKDTLLYASLCHGAVGGVCTAANFMPELITDVYNKFAAGDLQGSLEAQFKLNPVRLAMDPASFPVAAKDMAALRGRDVGAPYRPSLPTPEGPAKEGFRRTMSEAGVIRLSAGPSPLSSPTRRFAAPWRGTPFRVAGWCWWPWARPPGPWPAPPATAWGGGWTAASSSPSTAMPRAPSVPCSSGRRATPSPTRTPFPPRRRRWPLRTA